MRVQLGHYGRADGPTERRTDGRTDGVRYKKGKTTLGREISNVIENKVLLPVTGWYA